MSKVGYTRNPFRVFVIEYSFNGRKPRRCYSYRQTEEEALKETKDTVLWSWMPDFTMKVIEVIDY